MTAELVQSEGFKRGQAIIFIPFVIIKLRLIPGKALGLLVLMSGAQSLPGKKKENSSLLQKDKSVPNLECI